MILTDEEEKELNLRDKFAIAAMQAILTGASDSLDIGKEMDKDDMVEALDKLSMISYQIADAMRKARLASFK